MYAADNSVKVKPFMSLVQCQPHSLSFPHLTSALEATLSRLARIMKVVQALNQVLWPPRLSMANPENQVTGCDGHRI